MQKIKNFVKRFVKKDGFLYRVIRKIYHTLSTIKYKIISNTQTKEQHEHYSRQAQEAVEIIKKYKGKNYIVLYNPTWLGVANSTKGLFKNIVPLEHVYKIKDIQNIVLTIHKLIKHICIM